MGNVAVTATSLVQVSEGNKWKVFGRLTLSTNYASSGDTFTARSMGLSIVENLIVNPAAGYVFQPDVANLRVQAWAWRPAAGSIGNNFVIQRGTALAATITGAIMTVGPDGSYPTTASSATARGPFMASFQAIATAAVENIPSTISTSLTTVNAYVSRTTIDLPGSLPVYVGTSNLNDIHTTATTMTDFWFIPLSDGGLIPVSSDTTGGWRLLVTDTPATGLRIATTGSVNVSIAVSTSRALSLGATYNTLTEVSSAANLSLTTARFEAIGVP